MIWSFCVCGFGVLCGSGCVWGGGTRWLCVNGGEEGHPVIVNQKTSNVKNCDVCRGGRVGRGWDQKLVPGVMDSSWSCRPPLTHQDPPSADLYCYYYYDEYDNCYCYYYDDDLFSPMKLSFPSTLLWAAATSSSSPTKKVEAFSVMNRRVVLSTRGGAAGTNGSGAGGSRTTCTTSRSLSTSTTTAATVSEEDITTSPITTATTPSRLPSAYDQLVTKLEAIAHLRRASAVLSYDQQVFMPSLASAERGAQLAALATVVHQQTTDPELLQLMDQIMSATTTTTSISSTLDPSQRRLIELERKAFVENARVPTELAAHAAELSSRAYQVWTEARHARNFSLFESTLQECVNVSTQLAAAKRGDHTTTGTTEDLPPSPIYDFMLDEYESGMTKSRIDDLFQQVQDTLVPLRQKVLDKVAEAAASQNHHKDDDDGDDGTAARLPSTKALRGTFEIPRQQELSEQLVKAIGFNTEAGRIDVSVHPFTSSLSPSDVRITSRFRSDEWYQGLAASLHEAGHAMYEQGLPNKSSALSIDTALSMGTHESQSLFWERHVGLSKAFWKYATPIVQEKLPLLANYSSQELYGAVNAVSDQSLIRVEADELSYPLHVILRYQIEKDVMDGTLQVADIPQRWNSDMKHYLNVDVPSEDKGCLQDVHWASMAFGYFPTYLIGAMAAAQLFHYCSKDMLLDDDDDDIHAHMERGEFQKLKEWLSQKVHRHGRRYASLDDLFEDQLGEPLNPQYFLDYLTEKYSDLYQL
jgi:carboxypeptidase Taq